MQSRNAILSASYQALHLLAIIRIVMLLPCTAYDLVILREYAVYPEYQIATLYQLVIILFDGRMFGSIFRLPVVEIVKYGFRRFRIRPVEKIVMQLCTGVKAFLAAFRLAFAIKAKQIRRIIPKKIRQYIYCSFYRRRKLHYPWPQHSLFTRLFFFNQRQYLRQSSVSVYTKSIAYLYGPPALPGYIAAVSHILIQPRQSLKYHLATPLPLIGGTSSTPSFITARKNTGFMSEGSE